MSKYLIYLYLSLACFSIFAEDSAQEFLPHMAIHMNKGCQQNSSCTPKIGTMNLQWDEVLKSQSQTQLNRFKNKYGLPISFWTTQENNKEMITFDSRCSKHRKKDHKIYEAIMFSKGPKHLLKNTQILPNLTIHENTKKLYLIPRKTLPSGIKSSQLYFTQDKEGHFYYLKVGTSSFDASFKNIEQKEIIDTNCPEKLRELFISKISNPRLYQSTYCKKIWNHDSKKYERFIFGWSCL